MQLSCSREQAITVVIQSCFLGLWGLGYPLASAADEVRSHVPRTIAQNPDGATLPPPVRKSTPAQTLPNASADESSQDKSQRHSQNRHIFQPLDLSVLNLSEEQKQKIQQMRSENASKAKDIRRRFKDTADKMRDMMFDVNSTDAQIRSKRNELRHIHEQMEDSQLSDFLAIRALLTPEQRLKFKDAKVSMAHPFEPNKAEKPGDNKRNSAEPLASGSK